MTNDDLKDIIIVMLGLHLLQLSLSAYCWAQWKKWQVAYNLILNDIKRAKSNIPKKTIYAPMYHYPKA